MKPPLLLTQGDPCGIGPEITLKAWLMREAESLPPFAWIGDPEILRAMARHLGLDVAVVAVDLSAVHETFAF